jgi:hypothetical protein
MTMNNGLGANIPNEQKRLHLIDIGREDLVEVVCVQEVLPPES